MLTKLFFPWTTCGLTILLTTPAAVSAQDYFISSTGDDDHPGTTEDLPWKSIDKVNSLNLQPGDRVLFKGGETFTGELLLSEEDSGRKDAVIGISSYGKGVATLFNPEGNALKVNVGRYLRISNLKLKGPGYKVTNGSQGMSLIWLSDSEIHDVETEGFHKAGLYMNKCERVRVTKVYAHDNGFAGIHTEGGSSDLYIGQCRTINNPGDQLITDNHSGSGIFVSFTKDSMVEGCEAAKNGWDMPGKTMGPVGIWTAFVDNITIQHCISHNNKTAIGAWDGGGFDFDGDTHNSTLQYNYSFNNMGAGYLLCTFENVTNSNNTVRYNISENDGSQSHRSGIFAVGSARQSNTKIYNNTIINSDGRDGISGDSQVPDTFEVYNNIIVIHGEGKFYKGMGKAKIHGNMYWNSTNTPQWESFTSLDEWRKATGNEMLNGKPVGFLNNPLFQVGEKGRFITDPTLIRNLSAYMLTSGSPCIDNALDLRVLRGMNIGTADFFGNAIPQVKKLDVGAHEWSRKGAAAPSPK